MNDALAWALSQARAHTLALVADAPGEDFARQARAGERHPAWLLGHLLLADTYLLHLLGVQPLDDDFAPLIEWFGPASSPDRRGAWRAKDELVARLIRSHDLRLTRVAGMTGAELAGPLPDPVLAQAQPTIGHHLHGLVFHEGYHAGQISNWRATHGLPPVPWTPGRARGSTR